MEFNWTETQTDYYRHVLEFARTHLNAGARERDRAHEFGREQWRLCAEHGLQGLCAPTQYGGLGLDTLTTARIFEAFGLGCEDTGLGFSIAAHLFACVIPISEFGTDSVKKRLLPDLCRGAKVGANAITEAESGSDAFAMKTVARRVGDFYELNGTKTFVTNATIADAFIVFAVTQPALKWLGLSAFVVERDALGLTIGKPFDKVGLTTSPTSAIYLDDCKVPALNLLGDEGQGAVVFSSFMQVERTCLFALYLGVMQRQLDLSIEYARNRRQFGRAISKFQAVSHRIARMKMRLEAARLLLYRACWLNDSGQSSSIDAALAKACISEAAIEGGLDAMHIFGANGAVTDYRVERLLRDALPGAMASGTSDIMFNIIATELGL